MAHESVIFAELVSVSGLTAAEVQELVDFGVLTPEPPPSDAVTTQQWSFPEQALELARLAGSLRTDFELNPAGLALLLTYRERMVELQRRVRELECRLVR
jgi:hypothetical protein